MAKDRHTGYGKRGGVPRGRDMRPEDDSQDFYLDEDYDDDGDLFDDVDFDGDGDGDGAEDDDIAGDSGMEDKIFRQAMRQENENQTKRGQESRNEGTKQSGAGSYGAYDRRGNAQQNRQGQGAYSRGQTDRYGRDDDADEPDSDYGNGSGRQDMGRSAARKAPRELNTAVSAIDRRKLSREREQKKKSNLKKIIAWIVVEALTLCAIFGYGFVLRRWNMISRPEFNVQAVENANLSVEKKEQMEKGYWNIAIFGVDGRDNDELTSRGLNSDVIMIASINNETGEIRLCSVFRDTYLNISKKNTYNKINAAYAQGGPEQALDALNKNLDLNITNYITFNWKAVVDGINILQGVDDIDISTAELHYINAYITETVKVTGVGSHQLKKTGPQHLDGVQAVAYARLRYMDSDFARTERQKKVIKACFEKARKADFSVLNNIMVVCFPQVATNISMGDIVQLARNITRYNIGETGGFPWARGDALIPKKGACVIPATLESNVVKLHEFLFDETEYKPSKAVLQYSQKIKEDSNLYKEGKPVGSVRTDEGVIQKQKTSAAADESEKEKESTSKKESKETLETDENGDPIYETDENGERVTTSAGEKETKPTEKGKEHTSAAERPTDLAGDETEGDAGSDIVDNNGNVISPGETSAHPGAEPAGPHTGNSTTPGGTSAHPGQTSAPADVPDEPILVPSTTAAQTEPAVPGGVASDGPGMNGPSA